MEDKKATQLYKELQASHTVISEEVTESFSLSFFISFILFNFRTNFFFIQISDSCFCVCVWRRQKEAVSQKHSELEATLKKSQEELEAKTSMIVHLESLVKDLEKKVQLADAKSKVSHSYQLKVFL